jgi:hypothetical protein
MLHTTPATLMHAGLTMNKHVIAILACIPLIGCDGIALTNSGACENAGFTRGTDQFANCMLYQQALDTQRSQNAVNGLVAAAAIQAYSAPQQVYVHSAPQTCRFYGNLMQCH